MKVNWMKRPNTRKPYFESLNVGDSFKNQNGHGAIYTKVQLNGTNTYYMLEIATGKLFVPTVSPLELVDVEVSVASDKPSIY